MLANHGQTRVGAHPAGKIFQAQKVITEQTFYALNISHAVLVQV